LAVAAAQSEDRELRHHRTYDAVLSIQAPVDGVTLAIGDAGRLAAATRRARRTGFGGKLCVHPSQVSAVNECFVPTATELEWANSVIERAASSSGAFMFEGRMIDAPVIERAQRLLRHMKPRVESPQ
jgi:citrate lyase subunit beta/citryl-CoA lyase